MVERGAHVVSVGDITSNQALYGAVCKAVWDAGGITTIHLPPSTTAVVQALDAARLGVTMIEHRTSDDEWSTGPARSACGAT